MDTAQQTPSSPAVALTIAGSDPSGGAGIQADLKTMHQHGAYGMGVLTLLTVQNTRGVEHIHPLEAELVLAQLEAVLDDISPRAAKTGALGSAAVVTALARRAASFDFPLVVDPVLTSTTGATLAEPAAYEALKTELLPLALLVTPNLAEAATLTQTRVHDVDTMRQAAAAIAACGVRNVLITGGHLPQEAVDVLWLDGRIVHLSQPRIDTPHTHGSGCVLSAAITARLAAGNDLESAVRGAKRFVTRAIATNPGLGLGRGPLNLFAPIDGVDLG